MSLHAPKRRKFDHALRTGDGDIEDESGDGNSRSGSDTNPSAPSAVSQKGSQSPKILRSRTKPMSTKDMYNSDMFQIQLDELLAEVRPNYEKVTAKVERTLRKMKQIIENIPARDPQPVSLDLYLYALI